MKTMSILFLSFLFSTALLAQSPDKIKVSGGFIIPSTSVKGFTANIEYERRLTGNWKIYFYSGIYTWNKNQLSFESELKYYSGYSEDEHILYPLYAGAKLKISSIKTFTVYANFELGYNFISYNEYKNVVVKDENTQKVIGYYTYQSSGKKITDGFFGFGVGLGITQEINENVSLMLEAKRNVLLKSSDDLPTHYYYNAGVLISI